MLDLGLSFQWQRQSDGGAGEPVARLPFSPRCGMSPMMERRTMLSFDNLVTGVVGGQLSYNDTQRCTAPIVTLNEVWSGLWSYTPPYLFWDRYADAPFTPRRSMQVEDAIVQTDELITIGADNHLDKLVTLAGGITYLTHRFDALLNRSITTQAEVWADTWSCSVDWECEVVGECQCDWFNTYPMGKLNARNVSTAAPSGSLPVPVAFGTSAAYPFGAFLLNTRIGGAVPEAALQEWSNTPLRADTEWLANRAQWGNSPQNVTLALLQQPNSLFSRVLPQAPTADEVNGRRHWLPLSYRVDEVELNSLNSSFALGADLVMTHTAPYWRSGLKPVLTSVGAGTPPATTSAAAATSIRRRLGHAMGGTWDTAIISGGHSGDAYSSEWISYEAAQCWWPEDPSYFAELGAVRFVSLVAVGWRNHAHRRYWTSPGMRAAEGIQVVGADILGAFQAGDPNRGGVRGWLALGAATVTVRLHRCADLLGQLAVGGRQPGRHQALCG